MNTELSHSHPPESGFSFSINGRAHTVRDREPQGDQLLASGGFEPVDDHVLIQKRSPGSRVISLDETVDLAEPGAEVFFAFRTGVVFPFTVDSHGYQWGAGAIDEATLRTLAEVPDDRVLVLRSDDEAPVLIDPGESVPLTGDGIEHFGTESRLVTVYLDGDEKEIPRGDHTTEALHRLLGVAPGYLLSIQLANGLEFLTPGQVVRVKQHMRFVSSVPDGASS